jgi:MinD-like ATPase involved in chromosome partitioning or flagellar assembly
MEELADKTLFHCIITGPTNCGKTKYFVDILRSSYRNVFEYIILICPAYIKNETYKGFANNDPRFIVLSPDADSVDEINELLSCCNKVFSGYNTLLILDDCAF